MMKCSKLLMKMCAAHFTKMIFISINGIFNLTSTYNWLIQTLILNSNYDSYGDRKAFAATFMSNCQAGYRLKFIDVGVFSWCGRKCPQTLSNGTKADCKEIIGEEYKFYFAFENIVCEDFFLEKFHCIQKYDSDWWKVWSPCKLLMRIKKRF